MAVLTMSVLVRSFSDASVHAEFDPATGVLLRIAAPPPADVAGFFAQTSNHEVVFFRADGRIWLHLDGATLEIDGATSAEFDRPRAQRLLPRFLRRYTFRIRRQGRVLVSVRYSPPTDAPWILDPLPVGEEEDHDVWLFVANVLSDPARREWMRTGHRDD